MTSKYDIEQTFAKKGKCTNLKCNRPHSLIWQSWRKVFICGWCKTEYTLMGSAAGNLRLVKVEN